MKITSGFLMKNGRKNQKMKLIAAAMELHISDRTLFKYEHDKIKIADPNIISAAIELYGDENIGLAYLNENPVYSKLFSGEEPLLKRLVDKLKSAVQTALDNFGDWNNKPGLAY